MKRWLKLLNPRIFGKNKRSFLLCINCSSRLIKYQGCPQKIWATEINSETNKKKRKSPAVQLNNVSTPTKKPKANSAKFESTKNMEVSIVSADKFKQMRYESTRRKFFIGFISWEGSRQKLVLTSYKYGQINSDIDKTINTSTSEKAKQNALKSQKYAYVNKLKGALSFALEPFAMHLPNQKFLCTVQDPLDESLHHKITANCASGEMTLQAKKRGYTKFTLHEALLGAHLRIEQYRALNRLLNFGYSYESLNKITAKLREEFCSTAGAVLNPETGNIGGWMLPLGESIRNELNAPGVLVDVLKTTSILSEATKKLRIKYPGVKEIFKYEICKDTLMASIAVCSTDDGTAINGKDREFTMFNWFFPGVHDPKVQSAQNIYGILNFEDSYANLKAAFKDRWANELRNVASTRICGILTRDVINSLGLKSSTKYFEITVTPFLLGDEKAHLSKLPNVIDTEPFSHYFFGNKNEHLLEVLTGTEKDCNQRSFDKFPLISELANAKLDQGFQSDSGILEKLKYHHQWARRPQFTIGDISGLPLSQKLLDLLHSRMSDGRPGFFMLHVLCKTLYRHVHQTDWEEYYEKEILNLLLQAKIIDKSDVNDKNYWRMRKLSGQQGKLLFCCLGRDYADSTKGKLFKLLRSKAESTHEFKDIFLAAINDVQRYADCYESVYLFGIDRKIIDSPIEFAARIKDVAKTFDTMRCLLTAWLPTTGLPHYQIFKEEILEKDFELAGNLWRMTMDMHESLNTLVKYLYKHCSTQYGGRFKKNQVKLYLMQHETVPMDLRGATLMHLVLQVHVHLKKRTKLGLENKLQIFLKPRVMFRHETEVYDENFSPIVRQFSEQQRVEHIIKYKSFKNILNTATRNYKALCRLDAFSARNLVSLCQRNESGAYTYPPKLPLILTKYLKAHQKDGIIRATKCLDKDNPVFSTLLAHIMGLGKSLTMLIAASVILQSKFVKRVIISVPSGLFKNVNQEIQKWFTKFSLKDVKIFKIKVDAANNAKTLALFKKLQQIETATKGCFIIVSHAAMCKMMDLSFNFDDTGIKYIYIYNT